jgi:hypothetical protein
MWLKLSPMNMRRGIIDFTNKTRTRKKWIEQTTYREEPPHWTARIKTRNAGTFARANITVVIYTVWAEHLITSREWPDMGQIRTVYPKWVSGWGLLLFFITLGCSSKGGTRLFEDFQSYQTPESVRSSLAKGDHRTEWKEESKSFNPSPPDKRPPYSFTYMMGPYESLGVQGELKFTFYNNRLMEVQFSTMRGREYLEALRQHFTVPAGPSKEIVIYRQTKFRFDVGQDGIYHFIWFDAYLQAEWLKWAYAYS